MSTLINRFAPFDDDLAGAYERNLLAALLEDIGTGDLTGKLVPEDGRAVALLARRLERPEAAVLQFEEHLVGVGSPPPQDLSGYDRLREVA